MATDATPPRCSTRAAPSSGPATAPVASGRGADKGAAAACAQRAVVAVNPTMGMVFDVVRVEALKALRLRVGERDEGRGDRRG